MASCKLYLTCLHWHSVRGHASACLWSDVTRASPACSSVPSDGVLVVDYGLLGASPDLFVYMGTPSQGVLVVNCGLLEPTPHLFTLVLHLVYNAVPALLKLLDLRVDLADSVRVRVQEAEQLVSQVVQLVEPAHLHIHVLLDALRKQGTHT